MSLSRLLSSSSILFAVMALSLVCLASCGLEVASQRDSKIAVAATPLMLTAAELAPHIPDKKLDAAPKNIFWDSFMEVDSVHYESILEKEGVILTSTLSWTTDRAMDSVTLTMGLMQKDAKRLLKNDAVTTKHETVNQKWGDRTEVVSFVADGKPIGIGFVAAKEKKLYLWMLCGAHLQPEKLMELVAPKLEAFEKTPSPVAATR
ncbi:MAG: hypothetical protein ACAH88_19725 [Roseimicrobium sp.]